mmetsp:Transcript_29842/g.58454  ORF Transcript_29842/g.58454 Transcript_29842/m.58454 type:complete len:93 (+) Transcript_29842:71-349(+)
MNVLKENLKQLHTNLKSRVLSCTPTLSARTVSIQDSVCKYLKISHHWTSWRSALSLSFFQFLSGIFYPDFQGPCVIVNDVFAASWPTFRTSV